MDFQDGLDDGSQDTDSGGVNPAWNDVLELIPEDSRDKAIPKFREWDNNYQTGVQKVQSEYEPYKFLKEDGIPGDDVRMALGIMNAIQSDPESVIKSMIENFGYDQGQSTDGTGGSGTGQGDTGQASQEAIANLPPEIKAQLDRLQTGQETMAQIILAEQQKQEEAARDEALKSELDSLKTKHGDFDDRFVLSYMQLGETGEDAVAAYKDMVTKWKTENNRPKPPRLLGSGNGAGIPGQKDIDPRKLSNNETKNLVTEYLRASQNQ